MKINFIYKILPVITFEVEKILGLKKFRGGKSYGLINFIKKSYSKEDKEVMSKHELVHSEQFYRTLGFHLFLYPLWTKYAIRCEVEAYTRTDTINEEAIDKYISDLVDKLANEYSKFNGYEDYIRREILGYF